MQSFNQPIQHSRPACSKRNSHERLLALALGVKMVVCLGPLLVLASVIVIACYSAATNDVLNAVLPDASFTGRTDVWRFAIDHAMERPLTDFGFMAFWRTRDVFSAEMANFWANLAAHSHDGYLDIALTTGLPGLAFTLLLVVVMPLINFHNRADRGACCRCCSCDSGCSASTSTASNLRCSTGAIESGSPERNLQSSFFLARYRIKP